jgi:hypothetical protein
MGMADAYDEDEGMREEIFSAEHIGVPPTGYSEEDEREFFHPGYPSNFGFS